MFEDIKTSTASSEVGKFRLLQIGAFLSLDYSIELIAKKTGKNVFVRFDPFREKDKYTIVIGAERLTDTDEPAAVLEKYWHSIKND